MSKKFLISIIFIIVVKFSFAAYVLIPMDEVQKNHLKAYGIAYWVLERDVEVSWLLNYRGGSFMIKDNKQIQEECNIRGITFELIADAQSQSIIAEISAPEINMDEVKLHKAPKIAIYSPKNKLPFGIIVL